MSTATSIAPRSAAEDAGMNAAVVPIACVDYNYEVFRKFN